MHYYINRCVSTLSINVVCGTLIDRVEPLAS